MMKKLMMVVVTVVASVAMADAASVSLGTPQQRYPWNGKMDIPYTLAGTDAAKTYQLVTTLTVAGVTKAVTNELGQVADGNYANTVDCAALFGTAVAQETATVKLAVLVYAKPVIAITPIVKLQGPFLIIDLTPDTNGKFLTTECDYAPEGAWTKDRGWGEAYKRDYIVLRKVAEGTYPGYNGITKSTAGYWIGVFEVTEAQYDKVMGMEIPSESLVAKGAISYQTIRGNTSPADSVTQESFMGILCDKCIDKDGNSVIGFDLPTEWQWNIAYCAGTTTEFYWGGHMEGMKDADQYAWYSGSDWSKGSGKQEAQEAGLKKPNAWGLYDIAGNVQEWCRDMWFDTTAHEDEKFRNLKNADQYNTGVGSNANLRPLRGGSFLDGVNNCAGNYRSNAYFALANAYSGFRLSRMSSK